MQSEAELTRLIEQVQTVIIKGVPFQPSQYYWEIIRLSREVLQSYGLPVNHEYETDLITFLFNDEDDDQRLVRAADHLKRLRSNQNSASDIATHLMIDRGSEESVRQSFDRIAALLFSQSLFQVNDLLVFPVDIEFYLFDNESHHTDPYTLKHLRAPGELEAHWYGLDISLGNEPDFYGGILLKGLWHAEVEITGHLQKEDVKRRLIAKPAVIPAVLNALKNGENSICWEFTASRRLDFFRTTRNISMPAENDNAKKRFYGVRYRYLIKNPGFLMHMEGKEEIYRNSDLPKDESSAKAWLGYKLKS
jgi:hypothetical protein